MSVRDDIPATYWLGVVLCRSRLLPEPNACEGTMHACTHGSAVYEAIGTPALACVHPTTLSIYMESPVVSNLPQVF